MKTKKLLKNQEGFTLVEIIAVLIILGILAAVAVPRYIDLEENARKRAIDAAVSELNGRESLQWADVKISESGYTGDTGVWTLILEQEDGSTGTEPDLGGDYNWGTVAREGANQMAFGETNTDWTTVTREASTTSKPGKWEKQ